MGRSKSKGPKRRAGVYVGDVARDKAGYGDWFVGRFVPEGSLRHTEELELKWKVHRGRYRDEHFRRNRTAMTALIIVRGGCVYEFEERGRRWPVRLRAGEYVISSPGVGHKLTVARYAEILVVRCPSVEGDHEELGH